jgi:hypothetical protein
MIEILGPADSQSHTEKHHHKKSFSVMAAPSLPLQDTITQQHQTTTQATTPSIIGVTITILLPQLIVITTLCLVCCSDFCYVRRQQRERIDCVCKIEERQPAERKETPEYDGNLAVVIVSLPASSAVIQG